AAQNPAKLSVNTVSTPLMSFFIRYSRDKNPGPEPREEARPPDGLARRDEDCRLAPATHARGSTKAEVVAAARGCSRLARAFASEAAFGDRRGMEYRFVAKAFRRWRTR